VSSIVDPDKHAKDWGYPQWIAYTAATTLFFVLVLASLEQALLRRESMSLRSSLAVSL
jgi:hypothetical protein